MKPLLLSLWLLPAMAFAAVPVPDAGTSPLWGLLQVVFALAIVLGLIVGAAWLFRRISMGGMIGRWQPARVVSGVMVGPHERVVIVELEGQWLVLGVTSQRVNLLSTMPAPENPKPEAAADNQVPFAQRLAAAMLAKRGGKEDGQ